MVTQLFRTDFLATECALSSLNILRAAGCMKQAKNHLMTADKPYRGGYMGYDDSAWRSLF